MLSKRIIHLAIFLVGILLLSSCNLQNITYEKKIRYPKQIWTYSDSITYNFNIVDTASLYNFELVILHNDRYAFQNLYTKLRTTFPDGKSVSQVVNFDLAESNGKWEGDRIGSIFKCRTIIQENAFFNMPGKYKLTLLQNTRTDTLPGIKGFDFRLLKSATKKSDLIAPAVDDKKATKTAKTKKKKTH